MKLFAYLPLAFAVTLGSLSTALADVDAFPDAPRPADLRYTITTDAAVYDSCAKIVVLATITNLLRRSVLVEDRLTRISVIDSDGNAVVPSGTKLLMSWGLGATQVPANGVSPAGRYLLADFNFQDGDCKPGTYKLTAYRVLRSGPLISNIIRVAIR